MEGRRVETSKRGKKGKKGGTGIDRIELNPVKDEDLSN